MPTPQPSRSFPRLLAGPILRHVGNTTATVWVQTDRPTEVEVLGCRTATFEVHGHHYALVEISGLAPASVTDYEVWVGGELGWPLPGSIWPASRIRTRGGGNPIRVVFGSCRNAKPTDPKAATKLGTDSLEVYAIRMAGIPAEEWPDALLLLGDQVYADEPPPQARRWLSSRRHRVASAESGQEGSSDQEGLFGQEAPPDQEANDFVEYAHLYQETWSGPEVRWLLSTVPTAMIFDDHDVRDDWNTSAAWRRWITAESWWPTRIRGALASYWVYQHIGNLSPQERHADPIWCAVQGAGKDAWPALREMATAADTDPASVRWSFRWDIDGVRLVMVDTRCGRMLTEGHRTMLAEQEFRWVEDAISKDAAVASHVLIGSSLPWLLAPAIHDMQSANEEACARGGAVAERLRQALDLEHWAAFRSSFDRLAALLHRMAAEPQAPATISVVSGDVHHSYVAQADFSQPGHSAVYQLVCSPMHHSVPWPLHTLLRAAWSGPFARTFRWVARRQGLPDPPLSWSRVTGPIFGNALATLVFADRDAELVIESAPHSGQLTPVARVELGPRAGSSTQRLPPAR
ncbi:MAG: alkaline phosphatase D family protein [Pseudonocardiaceae bacterium]